MSKRVSYISIRVYEITELLKVPNLLANVVQTDQI